MSRRFFSAGLNRISTKSHIATSQSRAERSQRKSERFEQHRLAIRQRRAARHERYLNAFKRAGSAFRLWWLMLLGVMSKVVRPIGCVQSQRHYRRSKNTVSSTRRVVIGSPIELLEAKALLAGVTSWDLVSSSDTGYSDSDNVTNAGSMTFAWAFDATGDDIDQVDFYGSTGTYSPSYVENFSWGSSANGTMNFSPTYEGYNYVYAQAWDNYRVGFSGSAWERVGSWLGQEVLYDATSPEVWAASTSDAVLNRGDDAPVSFTFNEEVYDLDLSEFVVINGTLSGNVSGIGLSRSNMTFTPSADFEGIGSVQLNAGFVRDRAGNVGSAGSTRTVSFSIDTKLPVISAGQTASILENASTFASLCLLRRPMATH